ncbi:hypothetical protein E5676_scaffold874G00460 [Cucumis melo var. makuwa]|uniref:Uncharacterized protein n=1 Tax=Cucumis melo var. makuwa TaxID=1194695 RepID=A0A5D3CII8_CUCMM|nr:hypothetical protein E6C27_scaffold98G001620 [Cucumis melo var. makuwa]TYK11008.1 hypothetical protein E5676_scaffold874G00460 [Cucumis melo var. makuwa]
MTGWANWSLECGISPVKAHLCNLDLGTLLLGNRDILLLVFDEANLQLDRLKCSLGFTKDQLVPTGSQIARVRERASSGAEAEVRAKASWRMTKSDRGKP